MITVWRGMRKGNDQYRRDVWWTCWRIRTVRDLDASDGSWAGYLLDPGAEAASRSSLPDV
jgi:hypothetical protein